MLEAILDTANSFASSAKKGAQALALSAALMLNYTPADAASRVENTGGKVALEQTVDTNVPHYIREYDVKHFDDRVDQTLEMRRVLHATIGAYGNEASYTTENNAMIFKENLYGKDVELILPEYTVRKDGKIIYTTNNGVKEISIEEMNVVRRDLMNTLKTAVDNAYSDLNGYTKYIIQNAEQDLKKSGKLKADENLADLLDKVVPGYEADAKIPGDMAVTYKDMLMIPIITKQGFVPRKLFVAPFDAWGLCYIDAGIVGYHPQARMIDYIHGKPTVLTHELYHNQNELQGNPLIRCFDAEMFASLAMLGNDSPLTFMNHSYFKKYRYLAKVYYGFDCNKEAMDSMQVPKGSTQKYDREKLRKTAEKIDKLSADMREVFLTKVGPMFYKDPFYWVSVNKDLADDAGAAETLFSAFREPTLLNGAAETHNWLVEYSGVIEECARNAEKIMKDKKPSDDGGVIIIGSTQLDQKMLLDLSNKWGFDNEMQMYKMLKTMKDAGIISQDKFNHFTNEMGNKIKSEKGWPK